MASFGETLRRERESREISLREIAETTKINIRHLEALEADRFSALPGGVFNRGFVRAYADYLGIDADQAVSDFLAAVSALGVVSNEGVLPDPARVAPRGRNFETQPLIDSRLEGRSSQPRISMGPDPRAAFAATEAISGDHRATGSRRGKLIALCVIGAGIILAAALYMLSDGREAPRSEADAVETPAPVEPSAEQEAFDPPDGMFVDAGPVVPEEEQPDDREAGRSEPPPNVVPPEDGSSSNTEPSSAATAPRRAGATTGATGGTASAAGTAPQKPPPAPSRPPERQPRTAAGGAGTTAPQRSEPPPAPSGSPSVTAQPAPPPPGPLSLEVEVTRETWLWLACDSQTRIDRRVSPGESTTMQCLRTIRVSAHDAGAIRLRVNGADCMPLGDDGARVYGYTIRFDDAHLICRSSRNN